MHGMAQTSDYLGALSLSGGPLQVVLDTSCTVTTSQAGSSGGMIAAGEDTEARLSCFVAMPNNACLGICGLCLHFPGSLASRVHPD